MKDVRFVVFHRAGPRWVAGASMFEQEGLGEHIGHYRTWLEAGRLMAGGPFLGGDPVGMMIPAPGVTEEQVRTFAAQDPAVISGLLTFELRPWMIGMSGS